MYATTNDIEVLWRPLTPAETDAAVVLIDTVEAQLRLRAESVGKDLDEMASDNSFSTVLKSVVVDVVKRYLSTMSGTETNAFSQMTQSALGYSFTGTYATPGGGVSIMKNDLKRLGLLRQRYGVIDLA